MKANLYLGIRRDVCERQIADNITRNEAEGRNDTRTLVTVYHSKNRIGEKFVVVLLGLVFLDMTYNYE
jgi:hypothetical protein